MPQRDTLVYAFEFVIMKISNAYINVDSGYEHITNTQVAVPLTQTCMRVPHHHKNMKKNKNISKFCTDYIIIFPKERIYFHQGASPVLKSVSVQVRSSTLPASSCSRWARASESGAGPLTTLPSLLYWDP